MREIKFRAKMVEFDGWVYGHYVNCRYKDKLETGHFIIKYPDKQYEIYTSTLGQFTGLRDKNSKEIYEGDIVKRKFSWYQDISKVVFNDDNCSFEMESIKELDNQSCCTFKKGRRVSFNKDFVAGYDYVEVLGNIYENPELLVMEP